MKEGELPRPQSVDRGRVLQVQNHIAPIHAEFLVPGLDHARFPYVRFKKEGERWWRKGREQDRGGRNLGAGDMRSTMTETSLYRGIFSPIGGGKKERVELPPTPRSPQSAKAGLPRPPIHPASHRLRGQRQPVSRRKEKNGEA